MLSVSDGDAAGDQARRYLGSLARVETLAPPAHDLSDLALRGGDLRLWIAGHIASHLTPLINSLDPNRHAETLASWQRLLTDTKGLFHHMSKGGARKNIAYKPEPPLLGTKTTKK